MKILICILTFFIISCKLDIEGGNSSQSDNNPDFLFHMIIDYGEDENIVYETITDNKDYKLVRRNKNGHLLDEKFFISEKLLVQKNMFTSKDSLLKKEDILSYVSDTLIKIGQLVTKISDKSIIEDMSYYYNTKLNDTLPLGEKVKLVIEFINKRDDLKFILELGDLDKKLSFKDSTKIISLEADSNIITYDFTPTSKGYNLILGIAYLRSDSVQYRFPFYKDYFVQ